MRIVDKIIKQLEQEMNGIGNIIDDRSLHCIPFESYVREYDALDRILKICKILNY